MWVFETRNRGWWWINMKPASVAQFIPIWMGQESDVRRLSSSIRLFVFAFCADGRVYAGVYVCMHVWVFGNVILQRHYPNTPSYRAERDCGVTCLMNQKVLRHTWFVLDGTSNSYYSENWERKNSAWKSAVFIPGMLLHNFISMDSVQVSLFGLHGKCIWKKVIRFKMTLTQPLQISTTKTTTTIIQSII